MALADASWSALAQSAGQIKSVKKIAKLNQGILTAHDIRLSSLFFEKFRRVQVAIDEFDFGILTCYLGTFVAVSHQSCYIVFWMSIGDGE